MLTLTLLCAAAAALVATMASIATALGVRACHGLLDTRTAAARVRLLLGAALLPALVTLMVMVAALSPLLGWIVDHCDTVGDFHAHPHICSHHDDLSPSIPIIVLAVLGATRVAWASLRVSALASSARRAARTLTVLCGGQRTDDGYVLPLDEPQAFVVGFPRGEMFLSRGLLAPTAHPHLQAIRAHEVAHLRRRDGTWRLLACLGLSLHVPGVAAWLERELHRAQEMAADACAARVVGSGRQVAEALLFMGRRRSRTPRWAYSFGATDLELRVHALLDDSPHGDAPAPPALAAALLCLGLGVAASANVTHHAVEILLGVLTVH